MPDEVASAISEGNISAPHCLTKRAEEVGDSVGNLALPMGTAWVQRERNRAPDRAVNYCLNMQSDAAWSAVHPCTANI